MKLSQETCPVIVESFGGKDNAMRMNRIINYLFIL
ncbi:hypothetical protein OXPF_27780 [Oxobacter pfennigii]|uniref:Uncharacterized protein n=1 Tax=Oxobacter pfennigii TaxID=36849 RepID=A0A0P8W6H2_9CLOT|nr:hypothetical protein OXPF_27780 [Oxobacter pfennigii]